MTEVHKLCKSTFEFDCEWKLIVSADVLMLGAGYESRPDQFARKLSTILYPFQGTQRRAVVLAQATREANGDLEDEGDDENSTELTELDYSDKYVHRNVVFRPYEIIKMATCVPSFLIAKNSLTSAIGRWRRSRIRRRSTGNTSRIFYVIRMRLPPIRLELVLQGGNQEVFSGTLKEIR